MKLKKISENIYEIPKEKGMNVPGRIFASEKLIEAIKKDRAIEQVKNVASLPGIIDASLVMPDAHQGYGFPIGGVAAFDLDKGIISPGGVGFDINCGVRVLATNISVEEFSKIKREVLHDFKRTIPSGVGRGHKGEGRITLQELDEVLKNGAEWAVERGMGVQEDLENCEDKGRIKNANPKDISEKAKSRGLSQLGTLGAGNHFLEVQKIDKIYDEKTAKLFGIEKGKILIMFHCGSRGLGHQVASDYIKKMEDKYGTANLPDRDLINAPIKSELGKKYLSAMNCAVNFAFCNRQMIMHYVREVLKKYFPKNKNKLVYDVCHNIAKIEKHSVGGKKKEVCVHRKGATRAFDKQPVIIPGSMGTASYLLVGTKKAMEISWGSTSHGAGRAMSRHEAIRNLKQEKIKSELNKQDIAFETGSWKSLVEEAPEAYKDIDEVIKVIDDLGICKKVARLKPIAVMKG